MIGYEPVFMMTDAASPSWAITSKAAAAAPGTLARFWTGRMIEDQLTKTVAAERQLVTAIRLFFDDGDAVAVHTLAAAARHLIHGLCEARCIDDFVAHAVAVGAADSRKDVYARANAHANWFKHADRDPDEVLENFDDSSNDALLWVASHDFARLTGEMPIEMQVLEAWFLACHPEKLAVVTDVFCQVFPGLQAMNREQRKRAGKRGLDWARQQGFSRKVAPPLPRT